MSEVAGIVVAVGTTGKPSFHITTVIAAGAINEGMNPLDLIVLGLIVVLISLLVTEAIKKNLQ